VVLLHVSFAEYCLFHRGLFQKRPMILRSLLNTSQCTLGQSSPFPQRSDPKWSSECKRNPRWSKFMSLFKWALWKETCDDHSGFCLAFRRPKWSSQCKSESWILKNRSIFIRLAWKRNINVDNCGFCFLFRWPFLVSSFREGAVWQLLLENAALTKPAKLRN